MRYKILQVQSGLHSLQNPEKPLEIMNAAVAKAWSALDPGMFKSRGIEQQSCEQVGFTIRSHNDSLPSYTDTHCLSFFLARALSLTPLPLPPPLSFLSLTYTPHSVSSHSLNSIMAQPMRVRVDPCVYATVRPRAANPDASAMSVSDMLKALATALSTSSGGDISMQDGNGEEEDKGRKRGRDVEEGDDKLVGARRPERVGGADDLIDRCGSASDATDAAVAKVRGLSSCQVERFGLSISCSRMRSEG